MTAKVETNHRPSTLFWEKDCEIEEFQKLKLSSPQPQAYIRCGGVGKKPPPQPLNSPTTPPELMSDSLAFIPHPRLDANASKILTPPPEEEGQEQEQEQEDDTLIIDKNNKDWHSESDGERVRRKGEEGEEEGEEEEES